MLLLVRTALALCGAGVDRARVVRSASRGERGASALEWAIISAILVTAAVLIGGIIYNVVQDKGSQLENCANQPVGAKNC
jgi:hypothetical protein